MIVSRAFILGMREFRLSFTTRCDTDALRLAYDWGREWAHRLEAPSAGINAALAELARWEPPEFGDD